MNARLADLMTLTASGNEGAFTELYQLTHRGVYAVAQRILRAHDHAEEVVQEVYIEIWTHASNYSRSKGSVKAWINTIAKRRAIDRVRSVSRDLPRDELYALRTQERPHDEVWEMVSGLLSAEGVRASLETLTDVQREAIELSYFDGYSHNEIAEKLGVPLGTLKSRIHQGQIELRKRVGVAA